MKPFFQNILKTFQKHLPLLLAVFLTFLIVYFIKQTKEHYAILVPIAICGLYWYIFRVDFLFLFLAFSVPLSTSLEMLGFHNALGVELFLPAEAILIALLAFVSYKLLFYFDRFRLLLRHPIFIAISIYLFTIFFTSITSEMPVISFKFFLSRLWLMMPPLVLGYLFFKQNNLNYHKFILLLSTSAALVVVFTIIRFMMEGMDLHAAHFVMQPFYKDHTVYGASITLIAFLSVFNIFNKKLNAITRLYFLMLTLILLAGIIFSFTRAAWLSILCALVVYGIMKLRISFRFLFISVSTVLLILISFWTEIYFALNKNSQDSSANFSEHVSSVSNISTDASNLERLNRWYCAIELWEERPVVGWGPGTYQFQYSAYQKSYTRSLISTNTGNRGNAHSEFLGTLSESGLIGLGGLLLFLITTLAYGIKLYHQLDSREEQQIVMGILLAIISYFIHGLLNNYLDTDKCAVPIWIGVSMLIVIGSRHKAKSLN